MRTLAETTHTTTATPKALFSVWTDIDKWSEYDEGIDWAKLDGEFAVGARFTLKAKGGPKLKGTIVTLEPERQFTDALQLFGARMLFIHTVEPGNNGFVVTVTLAMDGPLAWFWAMAVGRNREAGLETSTKGAIARAKLVPGV